MRSLALVSAAPSPAFGAGFLATEACLAVVNNWPDGRLGDWMLGGIGSVVSIVAIVAYGLAEQSRRRL